MANNMGLHGNTIYYGNFASDGFKVVAKTQIIDNPGTVSDTRLGYYDPNIESDDKFVAATAMVYLDNTDIYKQHTLEIDQTGVSWTISGSAVPDSVIYLSQVPNTYPETDMPLVELKQYRVKDSEGKIISVKANSNGTYQFTNLKNLNIGPTIVWYITSSFYAQTGAITATATPTLNNADLVGYFIYKTKVAEAYYCPECSTTYTCPACNGSGIIDNEPCGTCDSKGTITKGSGIDKNTNNGCRHCRGTGVAKLVNDRYMYHIGGQAPMNQTEMSGVETHTVQLSTIPKECLCTNCQGTGIIYLDEEIDCPCCSSNTAAAFTMRSTQEEIRCPNCNSTNGASEGQCEDCGWDANYSELCPNCNEYFYSSYYGGVCFKCGFSEEDNGDEEGNEEGCPNCGEPWNGEYCDHCGYPEEDTIPEGEGNCPNCYNWDLDSEGWCPACGYVQRPACKVCNDTKKIKVSKNCPECHGQGFILQNRVDSKEISVLPLLAKLKITDSNTQSNDPAYHAQGCLQSSASSFLACPKCNGAVNDTPNENGIYTHSISNDNDTCSGSSSPIRRYYYPWQKSHWNKRPNKNIDERFIVWTCADNADDILTIDTDEPLASANDIINRDSGWGYCDQCGQLEIYCNCCPYCGSENRDECGCEEEENPGSDECLAEGTLITMADGSQKPIETIQQGDWVMDKFGNPSKVTRLGSNTPSSPNTYYYFDDGTIIHEVYKHRFFNVTQGFYQLMKNWNIGDEAIKLDGSKVSLVSKEIVNEPLKKYSIYSSHGTYYANGLLSGQAFCNVEFLPEMSASKAINMLLSIDNEKSIFNLFKEKGTLVP